MHSPRGTIGSGSGDHRSYTAARIWVPMASTSRKPRLVISAVRASRRWTMALVATVEPCARYPTSPACEPLRSSSSASACMNPRSIRSGVEGTLAISTRPSAATITASVKVPPTSIPIRLDWCSLTRRYYELERRRSRPNGSPRSDSVCAAQTQRSSRRTQVEVSAASKLTGAPSTVSSSRTV